MSDKIITYQYRIKDSNKKLVRTFYVKSGFVNFVCNYCNDIQQQVVKKKSAKSKCSVIFFY